MEELIDMTSGRLLEIMEFARRNGMEKQLDDTLERLVKHTHSGGKVYLYPDFAPHSLYFEVIRNGQLSLNGGVIFHGPHDGYGSGSAPTFSVSVERSNGWQIHT